MTELDRAWAETQIEGMADGSLSAAAEKRMRAAMAGDESLAVRVERARELQRELAQLANAPVPPGQLRKLWRIASPEPKRVGFSWVPAGALATAAVVALSVGVYRQQPIDQPRPMADEQVAAVQDVAIAVSYLQKSMAVAQNEINEAVGSGVLGVLAASSDVMERTQNDSSQGDGQNDD